VSASIKIRESTTDTVAVGCYQSQSAESPGQFSPAFSTLHNSVMPGPGRPRLVKFEAPDRKHAEYLL